MSGGRPRMSAKSPFMPAERLDEGELGAGLHLRIGADEFDDPFENGAEERGAVHDLEQRVEGRAGDAFFAGRGGLRRRGRRA